MTCVGMAVIGVGISRNAIWMLCVGAIAMLLFSFFGAFGVWKFFDNKPGIVINMQGFTDNSSGVSAGFVPWSDVTTLSEWSSSGQTHLAIFVDNPEKYANSGNVMQRTAKQANLNLIGTPILLSANTLKISQSELEALFRAYFDAAKAASFALAKD